MKNSKVVKSVVVFIGLFLLSFMYSFFISVMYNDEIWIYGFSYNIASGLVPYRDFNMIVTPLYSVLGAIFIKIFGNYLFSMHVFNSLVLASMMFISYKKLGRKSLILLPFIFLNCYLGYNIFSVLLILLIINFLDIDFKYKEYVLGIMVGLMLLTKQTIGITLLLPLIYYSKNKLKSLIGFSSVVFLFIFYLINNGALYNFLDYCFLGMFDFGRSNKVLLFFCVEIIICFIILYKLFKSKFNNQKLFYILMYQIVTIPICDDYHFFIGFIPVFYYILLVRDIKKYKIKYYLIISLSFFISWNFKLHQFEGLNFYRDKYSYLYGRNTSVDVNIDTISDYINDNRDIYNHIYMLSRNAYYVKLNVGYKLDKFDLINSGNMGYNGSYKYIQEIDDYCSINSCMFILYKYEYNSHSQTNKDIIDYVVNRYNKYEEVDVFDVYVEKIF